jgi:pseudouridine synthase
MQERLQKILSQWGIASRRHAEQMMLDGRVRVNGKPASVGDKADPQRDRIEVDGTLLKLQQRPQLVYLLLNKPIGVVCTCSDPAGRKTVLDLLPHHLRQGQGLHPVGRLDADSTGALIVTNDGDLTFRLTHPRHELPKTYSVWVEGFPTQSALQKWRQGVYLPTGKTQPARVEVVKQDREKAQTLLQITIREGKKRQIRRIGDRLGYPVVRLHRTAIGSIRLAPHPQSPQKNFLKPGDYRFLSNEEVEVLKHR